MSSLTRNGKNLILENVIVSYRPKDDSIQLTTTDPDLAGKPFQVVLKNGTETEQVLRNLLIDNGVINQERTDALLSKDASWKLCAHPDLINLGVTSTGDAVWNVKATPHALLSGTTGSGKSVLQRNVFLHCLAHEEDWEFYGIDMKRVEMSFMRPYTSLVRKIATDSVGAFAVLKQVERQMLQRYTLLDAEGATHLAALKNPPKAIMLMVDGLAELGRSTEDEDTGALRDKCMAVLSHIARLGRAVGVHLLLATQYPDPVVLPGELKANLGLRIAVGRMSAAQSFMTVDSPVASYLPPVKGRAILSDSWKGTFTQFQIGFSTSSDLPER